MKKGTGRKRNKRERKELLRILGPSKLSQAQFDGLPHARYYLSNINKHGNGQNYHRGNVQRRSRHSHKRNEPRHHYSLRQDHLIRLH